VVFGEKGAVIVGGSDCGKVYVFDIKSSTLAQLITHGKPTSLIQAIIVKVIFLRPAFIDCSL
jgi:hypothetical protein